MKTEFSQLLTFEKEEVVKFYLEKKIENLEFEIKKENSKWQSTTKQNFELEILNHLKSKI